MAELNLACGGIAIVDYADLEGLDGYKWYRDCSGYVLASAGLKKSIRLHRFLLGAEEGQIVDHINGDKLDNRRSNLRICSHAENMRNRGIHKNNNLGIKGVYFDASKSSQCRYRAQIRVNGNKIHLGRFATSDEASRAYKVASLKYHGEYSRQS